MQVFEDESLCYIDQERVRYITPTFNNGSKLEFHIAPNNAYSAGLESSFRISDNFCSISNPFSVICAKVALSLWSTFHLN